MYYWIGQTLTADKNRLIHSKGTKMTMWEKEGVKE